MILQPNKTASRRRPQYFAITTGFLAVALLAGCGGGGGGGGGGGYSGPTVTVQGQITDNFNNNAPVDGVKVKLVGTNDTTTSYDNTTASPPVDGWYSLSGVPANKTVTIDYTDPSTNLTDTETITTGTTTYTENVSYPFSLPPP